MPAVTNNDTILKAINQMVQALLDLNIGSGGGGGDCPDVTVNLPAPVVNVTVRCGGCGGGGSDIGSGSPIDDDEATGTTPPQAGAPVDEAKCKRVNFIIDKYINFMGIWSAINGLLAIGPAEMMAAYLAGTSTLLGAFSSLLVAGAVVTLFWAVVALFIGGGLTTAYIVAHLVSVNSNRADWVCAMYNAGDVAELRQAIVDFLGDNLAGLPQSFVEYHVDHLFPNNVLNGVFNGWTGDVAAELDAYTSPADCGGCEETERIDANFNTDLSGFINTMNATYWWENKSASQRVQTSAGVWDGANSPELLYSKYMPAGTYNWNIGYGAEGTNYASISLGYVTDSEEYVMVHFHSQMAINTYHERGGTFTATDRFKPCIRAIGGSRVSSELVWVDNLVIAKQ